MTSSSNTNTCQHCGALIERGQRSTDVSWSQTETCLPLCRKAYRETKRALGLLATVDVDEPSAEEREEIEQRKAEVRAAAIGHLAFAGVD